MPTKEQFQAQLETMKKDHPSGYADLYHNECVDVAPNPLPLEPRSTGVVWGLFCADCNRMLKTGDTIRVGVDRVAS